MSRKIKFRAWDTTTNLMVDLQKITPFATQLDGLFIPKDERVIIEQFTGLQDKNGKGNDVFEGDIFEAIFSDVPNGFQMLNGNKKIIKVPAEVVFKLGKFMIKIMHPELKKYVYTDLYSFLKNEKKIVIGNIHKNPELLEVAK